MAYYIKAQALAQRDPMTAFAHLASFEAVVQAIIQDQAREDLEPGTDLTGGISFRIGCSEGEVLRDWQAVQDGLRGEG